MHLTNPIVKRVREVLTDDLRLKPWKGSPNPMAGHCYVACEVIYYMTNQLLRPCYIKHEGSSHWFLMDGSGTIIDPTWDQFETPVPYEKGIGKGFLTRGPSKRARIVLERLGAKKHG